MVFKVIQFFFEKKIYLICFIKQTQCLSLFVSLIAAANCGAISPLVSPSLVSSPLVDPTWGYGNVGSLAVQGPGV